MTNVRNPPIDYEKAFKFKGSFQLHKDNNVKNCTVEVDSLPDLVLTSGKIAVGDPFSVEELTCARKVKPGTYPIERAARRDTLPDNPDSFWYEVASLRVVLSRLRPIRWTPALSSTAFSDSIGRADECCVADAPSVRKMCGGEGGSRVFDLLENCGSSLLLDAETGGNLVRSGCLGYGSGPRCVFWGMDKNNSPCRLVFDFGVLSEAVYTEKRIGTVEELLVQPILVKTRYGEIEVRSAKLKQGKELQIRITGDRVKDFRDLEFNVRRPRDCKLLSLQGSSHVEFRYSVSSPKAPIEYPFTVRCKTGVRSLIGG